MAHHLRWQKPADGSDTMAMAQIRWHRTVNGTPRTAAGDCPVSAKPALSHLNQWGAPRLPDSPSIRMDVWKGEVIASTEEELLSRIPG
jgi:hypothetical protein